jgi:hypothetical protein
MNQDEKLKKMCSDFTLLNREQQDYILGIMQALVFAKDAGNSVASETVPESEPKESL